MVSKKQRVGLTKKREIVAAITKSHIEDGVPVPEACKMHGVNELYTYYNWKKSVASHEKKYRNKRANDKIKVDTVGNYIDYKVAPGIIRRMPLKTSADSLENLVEKASTAIQQLKDLKAQEELIKAELKRFLDSSI